jgi:diaminohydroxyphosphoribosylaminopyrimidine deaminase/5-amino-6-(5-phosphoribosylamino)uracil reductase
VRPRILKPLSKKNLVTDKAKLSQIQSGPVFPEDARWMRAAIALARRSEGRTGSNPPVGCVLVDSQGQLVAEGNTGRGGVPHAEVDALNSLKSHHGGLAAIKGGTAYVTLEPCAHHGKTPPCVEALIDAGISRLVVAITDPDERVNGKGLSRIEATGISVTLGVCADKALESLCGFLKRNQSSVPYCSLKIASSVDGRIALSDQRKRWVTGVEMRRYVHLLRSRADAIVTGIGTVISDNPQMTCRNEGLTEDSPPVFVFDTQLRMSKKAALFNGVWPVTIFCCEAAMVDRKTELEERGAILVPLASDSSGRPDIGAALSYLGGCGVNHLLVEAGAGLSTAFLASNIIDRIYWTQSNLILGGQALSAVGKMAERVINGVALMPEKQYIQVHQQMIGTDRLFILEKSSF